MAKLTLNTGDTYKGGRLTEGIVVKGKNVTIEDTVVECDGIALYSTCNCRGLTVKNCKVTSRKNNAVKIIADKLSSVIKDVVFEGCTFEFARMGAELQNHKNTDYKINGVSFRNCTFKALESTTYRYGISLSGYGKNTVISDCSFTDCVKGIEIVGFSNVDIKECSLKGSSFAFISSNDRFMSGINITDCKIDGKVRLTNCDASCISNCEINTPYVEIKKSQGVSIDKNLITSTSYYSVMINEASSNTVKENIIHQNCTKNRSVIRCYGKASQNNVISNNTIIRKKKVGKLWDNYSGATNNKFS